MFLSLLYSSIFYYYNLCFVFAKESYFRSGPVAQDLQYHIVPSQSPLLFSLDYIQVCSLSKFNFYFNCNNIFNFNI